MDKAQALQSFWSGFSLTAYDENSVPESATFPYITYTGASDSLGNVVPLSASVWYRSTSWKDVSQKVEQIEQSIYNMKPKALDSGYLRIMRGTPFAQRMSDPNDDMIKRYYLNINVEFLTAY